MAGSPRSGRVIRYGLPHWLDRRGEWMGSGPANRVYKLRCKRPLGYCRILRDADVVGSDPRFTRNRQGSNRAFGSHILAFWSDHRPPGQSTDPSRQSWGCIADNPGTAEIPGPAAFAGMHHPVLRPALDLRIQFAAGTSAPSQRQRARSRCLDPDAALPVNQGLQRLHG